MSETNNDNKRYLVILSGGGDTSIALIDQQGWDWIHSDPQPYGSWKEAVPGSNPEDFDENDGTNGVVSVTCGSYDNDRAMAFGLTMCGGWDSVRDVMEHCINEGLEIVDEYHGYLY